MKIVILTTEPSGDFLGSELIKSLRKNNKFKIFGVGGDYMKSVGFKSWIPLEEFNTIGIYEVLVRIFKFIKLFKHIEKNIRKIKPQIIITIDSPSFSYRMVKKLQYLRKSTQFIHYVAPTVWAWKSYRAEIFSNLYDQIFTLFDFEPKYFIKHGLDSNFVGHQIFYEKKPKVKKKKIIIFLPGSRNIEIKNNMKKLKYVISISKKKFTDYKHYILTFKENIKDLKDLVRDKNIGIIYRLNDKERLMKEANLAVAASGSVTLELIKYRTPTIVFYDTHWLTKIFIKLMVKVKFASIINIIYNKEIIPEFLFERFNSTNLINAMSLYLMDNKLINNQLKSFEEFCRKMIVNGNNPSDLIVQRITKKK